jgi:tetrahydromethanopterin S-methyltransferase subunit G
VSTGYTEPDPSRSYTAAGQGPAEEVSLGERLGNVTRDLSTLMRQEVALAKAEVSQSASQAGKGVGLLVGAGIGAFFVLLFLSVSLWWAIGNATGRGWAALIVAVVWAIIAAILLSVGRKELKKVRGIPTTTDTLGKIPNAVKGKEEDNR